MPCMHTHTHTHTHMVTKEARKLNPTWVKLEEVTIKAKLVEEEGRTKCPKLEEEVRMV